MKPFFGAGDMVAVQAVPLTAIKKGSVILFSVCDGAPGVMHRVINIVYENSTQWFLCQGDNRSRPDGYIHERQVIGKVVGRYHNRRFKPLGRGHEFGGLILSGCYRRLKRAAKRTIVSAWPVLSGLSRKMVVLDRSGHDRELVFMGWRSLRFGYNFKHLAVNVMARD